MGINCHISFFPVSELGASSGGGDKDKRIHEQGQRTIKDKAFKGTIEAKKSTRGRKGRKAQE